MCLSRVFSISNLSNDHRVFSFFLYLSMDSLRSLYPVVMWTTNYICFHINLFVCSFMSYPKRMKIQKLSSCILCVWSVYFLSNLQMKLVLIWMLVVDCHFTWPSLTTFIPRAWQKPWPVYFVILSNFRTNYSIYLPIYLDKETNCLCLNLHLLHCLCTKSLYIFHI